MRLLSIVLGISLLGWIGGSTWFYVCKVKNLCPSNHEVSAGRGITDGDNTEEDESNEPMDLSVLESAITERFAMTIKPLEIQYEGQTVFSAPENFILERSKSDLKVPQKAAPALEWIVKYLNKNPDKELQLVGLFDNKEQNGSTFQNLGLARADFIKQELVKRGIDENRIILSYGNLPPNAFESLPMYSGGVQIDVLDKNLSKVEEKALKADSRLIYFEWASHNIDMTDSLRQYITKTIQYLNHNQKEKLLLVGHTSNEGKDAYNLRLGKKRALETLKFFEEFGVDKKQVVVTSKGESQPIASNKTEEGMSKNRRVEIKLK